MSREGAFGPSYRLALGLQIKQNAKSHGVSN